MFFSFPSKKIFERKTFNSVVGVFSFSWFCLRRAEFEFEKALVSSILHVLGVTAVGIAEVAGLNPAIGKNIYTLSDTR